MGLQFADTDKIDTVILIVSDSLRADTANESMPFLKNIAADCSQFTSCYALGPSTPSSMSGVMQSRLPIHGGYGSLLPDSPPTIAEALKSEDVTCAGWHCNPHTIAERGFHRGFDIYADLVRNQPFHKPQDCLSNETHNSSSVSWRNRIRDLSNQLGIQRPINFVASLLKKRGLLTADPRVSAEEKISAFETWFSNSIKGDKFAYLHLMDTHMPYDPPDHLWEKSDIEKISSGQAHRLYEKLMDNEYELSEKELSDLRSLYEAEVEYVDRQLNELVSFLKSEQEWESTLLIFTSDHGELFGDRKPPHGSITGHPPYLCNELIHVPLVVAGGAVSSNNYDCLVSGIDLGPTIVESLSVSTPPEWEGKPLGNDGHDQVISTISSRPGSGDEVEPSWLHVSVRSENRSVLWWQGDTPTECYQRTNGLEIQYMEPDAREYEQDLEIARSYEVTTFEGGTEEQTEVNEQRLRGLGYLS